MLKLKSNYILLFLFLVLVSCDSKKFYEKNYEIPKRVWNYENRLHFDFEIKDTIAVYDFILNLRNTADYPFQNMYLFVNTEFPNGKFSKDTVGFYLADESGKWLGKNGLGDIIENKVLFKYGRFPVIGTYHVEIEHAMRKELLPDVLDVGLRLEKRE